MFEMPKLQPIPIKTKDVHYIVRLWRWITTIRKWQLLNDWKYTLPDGTEIIVPEGYIFDGASIPRLLWGIISPVGLLLIPSLIHDYAYEFDQLIGINEEGERFTYQQGAGRSYWDNLFKEVAFDVNGIALTSFLAWLAVVLVGWIAWYFHRKNS